ncbi:MAG: heavy-metal-associated domain-containing protein [Deltaproteobacteria bacterium]|nr:heavy-metal-associated domain-containing protein [Deltaproteobacteria bacterium]
MESTRFSIPSISCSHCVMNIKKALAELDGVSRVEGDPENKTITVEWGSPATVEAIRSALKEIDYPAVD